jgi:transcriptional regulator with XRE-family HTH domain
MKTATRTAALAEADHMVGQRIRARRLHVRKSQEALGKYCGISFQQVQKYENGKNRVGASRLEQIARFLEVPPSYFFGEIEMNGRKLESVSIMTGAMASREGQELLIAFAKIKNKRLRKALRDLAVALS